MDTARDTAGPVAPTGTPEKNSGSGLKNALEQAKEKAGRAEQAIQKTAGEAVDMTGQYIGSHPWQALAIAGSIGFIVGLLFVSRR